MFYKKKRLYGNKISIIESLTKGRVIQLKKAQEDLGFKNVWISDCKIKFTEGKKVIVYFDWFQNLGKPKATFKERF